MKCIAKKRYLYLGFMILIMLIIFVLSHQPGTVSVQVSEKVASTLQIESAVKYSKASYQPLFAGLSLRKYAHVLLYAVLGVAAYLNVMDMKQKWFGKLIIANLICCVYSCTDELHQMFIPERGATLNDLMIDAIGYEIGIILCIVFVYSKCKYVKKENK